jgi:aminopeptidase N
MRIIALFLVFFTCSTAWSQTHFCAVAKQQAKTRSLAKAATSTQTDLMNRYDVTFHHFKLNLERTNTLISGSVLTQAKVISETLDTFGLELHANHTVDSVLDETKQALSFSRQGNFLYVFLPSTKLKGQQATVEIFYHGDGYVSASAAIGSGFSSQASNRWGNRATWSLSQPYSAYEWFPCKQALQDKIDSVYMEVITSSDNKVGSNGVLKRVDTLPNNKVRFTWHSTYPIDYYLISVAVSDYVEYKTYAHLDGDSMLIIDYVYSNPQALITFKPILDQTAAMIETFSEKFGKYPFWKEKYGHSLAPFSGGMEHQTMTSLGIIDFNIVAHELGHQWFGDHVTCNTWSDIWLNEGFATYCEYLALEALNPPNAPLEMQQVHFYVLQSPDGSIAFTDTTNVNRIFDSRLTYNKGGAFVHMLRFEINNDSLFFAFLREYQTKFAYATASTSDFKSLLEQFTNRDFSIFFNQWFYGEGYPTFNVTWNQVNDTVYVNSNQTVSSTTPLFVTPLELKLTTGNGDTIVRVQQTKNDTWFKIPLKSGVSAIAVDPNNWLVNKSTSAKDVTITGLKEAGWSSLSFYPNPVIDVLHINQPSSTEVHIFDQLGREVMAAQLVSGELKVGQLMPGVYVLRMQDGFAKFIKQ